MSNINMEISAFQCLSTIFCYFLGLRIVFSLFLMKLCKSTYYLYSQIISCKFTAFKIINAYLCIRMLLTKFGKQVGAYLDCISKQNNNNKKYNGSRYSYLGPALQGRTTRTFVRDVKVLEAPNQEVCFELKVKKNYPCEKQFRDQV